MTARPLRLLEPRCASARSRSSTARSAAPRRRGRRGRGRGGRAPRARRRRAPRTAPTRSPRARSPGLARESQRQPLRVGQQRADRPGAICSTSSTTHRAVLLVEPDRERVGRERDRHAADRARLVRDRRVALDARRPDQHAGARHAREDLVVGRLLDEVDVASPSPSATSRASGAQRLAARATTSTSLAAGSGIGHGSPVPSSRQSAAPPRRTRPGEWVTSSKPSARMPAKCSGRATRADVDGQRIGQRPVLGEVPAEQARARRARTARRRAGESAIWRYSSGSFQPSGTTTRSSAVGQRALELDPRAPLRSPRRSAGRSARAASRAARPRGPPRRRRTRAASR